MTIEGKKTPGSADSLSTHNGFSLISDEKLVEIYTTMLRCRLIEKHIGAEPTRVAAIAGVAIDLLRSDTLAPSQGALIPCYVKGLSPADLLSIHAGAKPTPRPNYAALGLIPPSFTFARQLERSLAAAVADRSKKSKRIAVVFCGSNSAAGELAKAMKQAGKKKLPMLFVHESGIEEEDAESCARQFGFPAITVDGDDAVAVYRVATEAMAHARRGSGPTLIECKPWPHGTAKSRGSDPIRTMEAYLTRKELFSKKLKASVGASFRRELATCL